MKYYFNIFLIALFGSAIFLFPNISLGQKGLLELLPGAEKLSYNEKTGAQRLVGNVNFIYQGNTMYCDSAHFFAKTNEVKAFGKVHINKQDTLNLYCDSMYYNGKTKKARLWGHVRVRDREYKLSCDSLEYDAKNGVGIYRNGGIIENIGSKEVLKSKVGYIYPESKNFFFSGNVSYSNEDLKMTTDTLRFQYLTKKAYFYGPTKITTQDVVIHCSKGWFNTETQESVLQKNASILKEGKTLLGDSLYVNPLEKYSIGKGNVFFKDTAQPVLFSGNYLYASDTLKYAFLTGKALCTYIMKEDSLHIHADSIYSFQDSLNEFSKVLAYHHVRMFSNDFQGICDSLNYLKDSSRIQLFKDPIIWNKNAELKGKYMEAFIKDSIIEYVQLIDKSTAVMEVDSGNFYNQIGGKEMKAYFRENELIKVDVFGNAQTIYYPEETIQKDSIVEIKRSGMTRLYSSDLTFYLDSGEVKSITYKEQPDGVFYPMNKINSSEKFVQGFSWNPVLRPKSREDLFERRMEN